MVCEWLKNWPPTELTMNFQGVGLYLGKSDEIILWIGAHRADFSHLIVAILTIMAVNRIDKLF